MRQEKISYIDLKNNHTSIKITVDIKLAANILNATINGISKNIKNIALEPRLLHKELTVIVSYGS